MSIYKCTMKGLVPALVLVRESILWILRMFMPLTVTGLVPAHVFFLVSKGYGVTLKLLHLNVHVSVDC